MNTEKELLPDKLVMDKIYFIRNQKVMLDRDLAGLYGVETRVLNQAVKRNISRFPEDFMFQMILGELENWKSQIVTSNKEKMGIRKPPLVFTEQGLTMLSCVLNSNRAIMVNIQIIRILSRMREMILTYNELLLKLNELEEKVAGQDNKIKQIFYYLKQLIKDGDTERKVIGLKQQSRN